MLLFKHTQSLFTTTNTTNTHCPPFRFIYEFRVFKECNNGVSKVRQQCKNSAKHQFDSSAIRVQQFFVGVFSVIMGQSGMLGNFRDLYCCVAFGFTRFVDIQS